MPNYDYDCTACGTPHEIFHPIGIEKKKCPNCGKSKLKRAWRQIAAYHARYSPMHPRANRGLGNTGKRKDRKKNNG